MEKKLLREKKLVRNMMVISLPLDIFLVKNSFKIRIH